MIFYNHHALFNVDLICCLCDAFYVLLGKNFHLSFVSYRGHSSDSVEAQVCTHSEDLILKLNTMVNICTLTIYVNTIQYIFTTLENYGTHMGGGGWVEQRHVQLWLWTNVHFLISAWVRSSIKSSSAIWQFNITIICHAESYF